jgi:gas vesicle protein GvpL/GvpF
MTDDRTSDLLWAYCVLRAGDPSPPDLTGVSQAAAVERIEAEGLAVLVSRVPVAEFSAEPLRDHLNDLAWLERVARAHEAVLEQAFAEATIVPLRMCTLYESADNVSAMVERERASLVEALEALDGRQEWGVKLIVDPDRLAEAARASSSEAARFEDQLAGRSGGSAYMLRRRLERHVRETTAALASAIAEDVHAHLADWATDAVTRPPQNRELSGHQGAMLLNGAYLIEAERVDGLRELTAELEEQHRSLGARIELTGPWPPFNFVPNRAGTAA